jgi:hypothetical protein
MQDGPPSNNTLQRTVEQRWFAARGRSYMSQVVLPPPLSVGR